DLGPLADPGDHHAAEVRILVGMKHYGLAELALQLAAVRESTQLRLEPLVELARSVRGKFGIVGGEGESERVPLDLPRRADLDHDGVHRGAIVSEQGFTVPLRNSPNCAQL